MHVFQRIKTLLSRGVDPGEIRRPASIRRRDFLKLLGVGAVSVAVPSTRLWLPKQGVIGIDPASGKSVAVVLDPADRSALNRYLFERLAANDPILEKEALDAINDFTRVKVREEGFYRRILPPVAVPNMTIEDVIRQGVFELKPTEYVMGPPLKLVEMPKPPRRTEGFFGWAEHGFAAEAMR